MDMEGKLVKLEDFTAAKHEGLDYQCDQCGYLMVAQDDVNKHGVSTHGGVKFQCEQCKYQFKCRSYLKNHQEAVHGGLNYCYDQCNLQVSAPYTLGRHKLNVHKGVDGVLDLISIIEKLSITKPGFAELVLVPYNSNTNSDNNNKDNNMLFSLYICQLI